MWLANTFATPSKYLSRKARSAETYRKLCYSLYQEGKYRAVSRIERLPLWCSFFVWQRRFHQVIKYQVNIYKNFGMILCFHKCRHIFHRNSQNRFTRVQPTKTRYFLYNRNACTINPIALVLTNFAAS